MDEQQKNKTFNEWKSKMNLIRDKAIEINTEAQILNTKTRKNPKFKQVNDNLREYKFNIEKLIWNINDNLNLEYLGAILNQLQQAETVLECNADQCSENFKHKRILHFYDQAKSRYIRTIKVSNN
jgi:hypothetical protein